MGKSFSERTIFLAKIFAEAIKTDPNNAGMTARRLIELTGDRATFEEIIQGMSDPKSELAIVLTKMGRAFHSGNPDAPEDIEEIDLASMANQIRTHSRLR